MKIRVKNYVRSKRTVRAKPKRQPFVWPVHPKYLLWAAAFGVLVWIYQAYGTPHLRFKYSYSGHAQRPYYHTCDYIGLHSRRYTPRDGQCPLFKFFKARHRN